MAKKNHKKKITIHLLMNDEGHWRIHDQYDHELTLTRMEYTALINTLTKLTNVMSVKLKPVVDWTDE